MEKALWPDGNPNGWTRTDVERTERATDADYALTFNVSRPTLTHYPGPDPDALTVMVLPGGGYGVLAIEHEGTEVAAWLNALGLNAAILKYRIPNPEDHPIHTVPLEDVQQALRLLSGTVGLMGFSAGAHLAAMAANAPEGPHPAFTVLVYMAYVDDPARAPQVGADTPPAFLLHTADDPIPCASSLLYAGACAKAGVPVELHLFPKGGHGYGLRSQEAGLAGWPDLLAAWLKRL